VHGRPASLGHDGGGDGQAAWQIRISREGGAPGYAALIEIANQIFKSKEHGFAIAE
jgi:hypothetical protein